MFDILFIRPAAHSAIKKPKSYRPAHLFYPGVVHRENGTADWSLHSVVHPLDENEVGTYASRNAFPLF